MFSISATHRASLGRWLLQYARGEIQPIHLNAIEVRRAIERGFAPWLAKALETHGTMVSVENEAILRLGARAAALQGANLRERLAHIVACAARQDISVCLLKGAALEPWLYPGPGFRPMADVDLLVEAALQQRFERLLAALGYVQRLPAPHMHFSADHHHSMPFWHPHHATWIEVHTRLSPPLANALLADQEPFDYHGVEVRRLRARSQICYTVAHWAQLFPAQAGFVALLDLVLLLRRAAPPALDAYELDVSQRAWLGRALSTACSLLPEPVTLEGKSPPRGLACRRGRRLSRLAARYVLDDEPFGRWRSPGVATGRWQALMDTPSSALALLREPWWIVFPPREEGRFSPSLLWSRMSRLWRREV